MSTAATEKGETLAKHRYDERDRRLVLAHVGVAVGALLIGAIAGLLQVMERAGWIRLPAGINYYQMLTLHGVLLALVFTTFFIFGYLYAGLARTLDGRLVSSSRKWAWIGYGMMTFGTLLAAAHILMNEATVLYTFYPPLQASPWFYVGLALLVVGSWVASAVVIINYVHWRRRNRGESSPLFAYMALATVILWLHASLYVAIEVVVQLIPWSFGWVDRVNVPLSRTLFWWFGHALVYFWLLPAYIYWYVNIPQIIGGKILSGSLPRLTFILFLLFSIPVGFHHQLTDPGIQPFWKFLQVALTMAVVVPTLITAFSILGTFEMAGRARGAKGLFGWVKKLPWGDVRFFTPFMAMVIFIAGGAGGVIMASYQLNQLVHNTWFITGHFHMTMASTVGLTYFAALYWMIPILRHRKLTPGINRLGIIQTVIWTIGMLLMSVTMHVVGLMGAPRRSSFSTYGGHEIVSSWMPYLQLISVGGILLFVAILLAVYLFIHLWFLAPKTDRPADFPIGVVSEKASQPPRILERWSVWVGLSVVLSIIAYAVPLADMLLNPAPGALPLRPW